MARETGAMGRVAISTPGDWALASTAKREGFIAMAKHALGKKSFKPWTNFSWDDFVMLKEFARVFKTRHLPVSNAKAWRGKKAQKLLPHPKEWSNKALLETLSKKRQSKRTLRGPPPPEEDNDVICVWDSDEGGLATASPVREQSSTRKFKPKAKKRKRKPVQHNSAHASSDIQDAMTPTKTRGACWRQRKSPSQSPRHAGTAKPKRRRK